MILATNGHDRIADRSARIDRPGRPRFATRSRLALALTLGIAAALGDPAPCRAGGLVISAPDITTTAGSSGSFLVLITDTDPMGSTPYNVAGDQFELTLTGSAGVSFTAVTTATDVSPYNTPYIYSVSTDNQLGLPLYMAPTNPFPTTDFTAVDTGYFVPGGYPGYTTMNPGDVYALALVSYSVSPTAPMGSTDAIGFGASTSLTDNTSSSIPFATTSGSITIATASVPEPSSWTAAWIAIAMAPLVFRMRRRQRGRIEPGTLGA